MSKFTIIETNDKGEAEIQELTYEDFSAYCKRFVGNTLGYVVMDRDDFNDYCKEEFERGESHGDPINTTRIECWLEALEKPVNDHNVSLVREYLEEHIDDRYESIMTEAINEVCGDFEENHFCPHCECDLTLHEPYMHRVFSTIINGSEIREHWFDETKLYCSNCGKEFEPEDANLTID